MKNLKIQANYNQISYLEILKQASHGIAHLHNIDIGNKIFRVIFEYVFSTSRC